MVFQAGEGAGMSGSFFCFTHDNKFLIKTINNEEMGKLVDLLPDMVAYFKKVKNKTLLAKIYGLYTI